MDTTRVTFLLLVGLCAMTAVLDAQQLFDLKKLPKKITKVMCQCSHGINSPDRETRSRNAQKFCSDAEGIPFPEDLEATIKEEIRKPPPRAMAQWMRKQVKENEGVDNQCLNSLRELYVAQRKVDAIMKNETKEKQEAYATCFGKQMGWLKENGEIDKRAVQAEILADATSPDVDPKLRQSLAFLSVTCRGTTSADMQSYIRCASKPCVDSDLFDKIVAGSNLNAEPAAETATDSTVA